MKSGFVSLVGRPNAGKSTIINAIMKQKIAIVSPKPQTTTDAIRAVYNESRGQIVFVDTPGIHKPHFRLGEELNKMAYSSLRDVEATLLVVDASVPFGDGDQFLIDHLVIKSPLFIVFNKIDLTNFGLMELLRSKYSACYPQATQIEISALNHINLDKLLDKIIAILPEGPQYFPDGVFSDHPESFIVAELIREKIIMLTQEEIPHSIAVVVERVVAKAKQTDIYAAIIVEKESQKGIIIGKKGRMVKRIRLQSTYDIQNLLGITAALELYVKVEEKWRDSSRMIKEFGYISEE